MDGIDRTIAGLLGLAGFLTACVAGVDAGLGATATLGRAVGAMLVCTVVGLVIGRVAAHVGRECVRAYQAAHPMPKRPEILEAFDRTKDGRGGSGPKAETHASSTA
jgi:hypothetical protein